MAAGDLATVPELLALVPDASTVGPRAAATITVATHPVPAGRTVIGGSIVLTSVAGARTSGGNNFQGDGADAAADAVSVFEAINDPANIFVDENWTATLDSGAVIVRILGKTGPVGDIALVSSGSELVVSGFAGGSAWVDHALEFADCLLDPMCWGDWRNKASIYLAAHFLTMIPGGLVAGMGATTAVNIGSISKSFATAAPTDPRFGTSKWGQLYLLLAEKVFCAPGGVAGAGGTPLLGIVGCR